MEYSSHPGRYGGEPSSPSLDIAALAHKGTWRGLENILGFSLQTLTSSFPRVKK